MRISLAVWRQNRRSARLVWGKLAPEMISRLKALTMEYGLSVAAGDIQLLDNCWYITHSGLLGIAERRHCSSIKTSVVKGLSDPGACRWIFKATVHKSSRRAAGFVGYGDANPSNISPLVRGAEMRVAETRAVNRALRKAYGIGLCSVEELGYLSSSPQVPAAKKGFVPSSSNGNKPGNGQPRLRDRLCLLIRQHQLDPTLVKRYAANFCGTQEIREASRELVESFVTHLGEWAARDRSGLLCKLNSFAPSQEVPS
jgi:hypothetical protein